MSGLMLPTLNFLSFKKYLIMNCKFWKSKSSTSNIEEFTVFIKVKIEILNAFSKVIPKKVRNEERNKKDIINIVREEADYFIPQIQTKIMNEGWASYWHYRLMNELDLPQEFHIPFVLIFSLVHLVDQLFQLDRLESHAPSESFVV